MKSRSGVQREYSVSDEDAKGLHHRFFMNDWSGVVSAARQKRKDNQWQRQQWRDAADVGAAVVAKTHEAHKNHLETAARKVVNAARFSKSHEAQKSHL